LLPIQAYCGNDWTISLIGSSFIGGLIQRLNAALLHNSPIDEVSVCGIPAENIL